MGYRFTLYGSGPALNNLLALETPQTESHLHEIGKCPRPLHKPYPIVTDRRRKFELKSGILGTARGPGRHSDCDLDHRLFSAPNESPFHSL
jgi:hypothetical protein